VSFDENGGGYFADYWSIDLLEMTVFDDSRSVFVAQ